MNGGQGYHHYMNRMAVEGCDLKHDHGLHLYYLDPICERKLLTKSKP